MAAESAAWTWNDVVARLREAPTGSTLQIAVSAIAEPTSVGLHPMPTGPDARPVFGVVLDDQMGILVEVSGENYEARLCPLPQVAATPTPASALALQQATTLSPARPAAVALKQTDALPAPAVPVVVDSRTDLVIQRHREPRSLVSIPAQLPGETMLMTTLLGTLIGAAFGGARGAFAGALVGGGAGLASIAVSTAATSPATAMAAQTMFLGLAAASLGGRGSGPILRLGPAPKPALPPLLEEGGPPTRTRRLPPRKK